MRACGDPESARAVDHHGDRRRVQRAVPPRVGPLGRGVPRRRTRRRALRPADRAVLRRRGDVPHRDRRVEGGAGRARRLARTTPAPSCSTCSGSPTTWRASARSRSPVPTTSRASQPRTAARTPDPDPEPILGRRGHERRNRKERVVRHHPLRRASPAESAIRPAGVPARGKPPWDRITTRGRGR